jgi:hypothetical protein
MKLGSWLALLPLLFFPVLFSILINFCFAYFILEHQHLYYNVKQRNNKLFQQTKGSHGRFMEIENNSLFASFDIFFIFIIILLLLLSSRLSCLIHKK